MVNLTELYLSENGIEKLENLDQNVKIETLDVAKNRIKIIENIGHLSEMEEFWVSQQMTDDKQKYLLDTFSGE